MTSNLRASPAINSLGAIACGLALCLAGGMVWDQAQAQPPQFKVDPNSISVSGISSGADLAHQLHIAFSSLIHGVGLLAASPYYCAKGDSNQAMQYCSKFGAKMGQPYKGPPSTQYVSSLVAATNREFQKGRIDDPAGVKDDKIYLFAGMKDSLVPQEAMDAVRLYYTNLGVNPANIKYVKDVPAEHAMVTVSYGNDCSVLASPYINQCGSKGDIAHQILEHIYGPLNPSGTGGETGGTITAFDQSKFFIGGDSASMDKVGHYYVPKTCTSDKPCKLHVALHGCVQNDDDIQAQFYTHAGYNEWAGTNNIIVLYPQVQTSNFAPYNPKGCWDWWGYTDSNYPPSPASRSPQSRA